jgi:hypothetical protein
MLFLNASIEYMFKTSLAQKAWNTKGSCTSSKNAMMFCIQLRVSISMNCILFIQFVPAAGIHEISCDLYCVEYFTGSLMRFKHVN